MLRKAILVLALSFILVGAPGGAAQAGKQDNSIVYATELVPESIDPYFTSVWIGIILSHHVWDTLIYRDPATGEYKGQLATSWTWTDDRTLELTLRENVRFHDGSKFTADDVVFTLNFASDPANHTLMQQYSNWIEKVEKIDELKVRIIAKRPTPAAIEYLAGPLVMLPHKYYQEVGTKGMNAKPVDTGPFKVIKHDPGRIIELVRNDDYFEGGQKSRPKVDRVDPFLEGSLTGATGFVVIGRGVDLEHPAGAPDRYILFAAHRIDQLALPARLQIFRRMASCNIFLSRLRSATTLRSLAFSSSSRFNRGISVGSS